MPEEEILSLPQGSAKDLIKKGEMTVLSPPKEQAAAEPTIGKAKELFGEDFLGEEAIVEMERKCQQTGIDVKFEIPQAAFQYSDEDLRKAKEDANQGRERFVSLRPSWMTHDGERKPVTLVNLRNLFKDRNPFGDGKIFWDQDWYDNEVFAKAQMPGGYALPTKEVLSTSTNTTWNDQVSLLEQGEERRKAVETTWDLILHYASTGQRLLPDKYDWGESQSSDGDRVCVGSFGQEGVGVNRWHPDSSGPNVGVCPSR